ncbi:Uncharacterized conserved protein YloU, alkaline shock protein (Asp23) family [Nonomuraea maritima]|uniref:Uncharacterized conserved protein YloU, alkaline shock protein (Asp23) family n=1 Tax=Nonomuraea maritima TaxID=683260 RepID=A0A1G8XQC5_9ACTN|nr:Asp23/Gls24 family envelope stress response protein [Nonomuraea maritima]SDJ92646.1 Uncharacterized conserved protein YloU, alkaline shock protein (Asp23) family [Nonomuraea maritima]
MTETVTDHPTEQPDFDPEHAAGQPDGDGSPSYIEAPDSDSAVKGRIKVADEVVEKVAALATLEVEGVADMGGDLARAYEAVRDRIGYGSRRATQGVTARIHDREVAVSLVIVVEYGHVVMDVASEVKDNVAKNVSRMLGMRVSEVNVTVDDVRLPGDPGPSRRDTTPDDPALSTT